MKRHILPFAFAVLLSVPAAAFAQGGPSWHGSGGWGPGSRYSNLFDSHKIEVLRGEVVSVDRMSPMGNMTPGIVATLRTDKETVPVQLGPAWFLENQDVSLQPGDRLEVTGSRVRVDDKPVIIATRVKKGDETLGLREENGQPLWGWKRKG